MSRHRLKAIYLLTNIKKSLKLYHNMNSFDKLKNAISQTGSVLCVGLDSDIARLPESIDRDIDGLLQFNQKIIEATQEHAAAFKLNFAFYEQYGSKGFDVLKKTIEAIPDGKFIIADAKRGDIGNTSKAYAKSVFDFFRADAITVSPYMGSDSLQPFFDYEDKMIFILALTSNPGSQDFQRLKCEDKYLYEHVIEKSLQYGNESNTAYVVGATHPDELKHIREIIPKHFILIPGVGTQGGDVEAILESNGDSPVIINVSRDIIYNSGMEMFAEAAAVRAQYYHEIFTMKK